ncbi:MAG: hypothetical protein K5697_01075 [Lachnospiraceae bacterium]|nr:hypothetical protein [Lachnospiraceae bacterium]
MTKYELWLDESGPFQPEEQQDLRKNPSLVGGILIEQNVLFDADLERLVSGSGSLVVGASGFAHATDYDSNDVSAVVLPAMEEICRRGGKLVYFENRERTSKYGHRELYLRLAAAGIVQLLRVLAAEDDFLLDIYIAKRIDPERANEVIPEREYINELKGYIREARKDGIFEVSDSCRVNFSILSARQETRLKLADYCCNSRLTRNSNKFRGLRERLYDLFDDDYIFSFDVKTSEGRIDTMLANERIAEAWKELYTGYGELDHAEKFETIMDRFAKLSYRLQRIQLNSFVSGIVTYVRAETDFERSEPIVVSILDELIPVLKQRGISVQNDAALFNLNSWLLDIYLREGDIRKAAPVLEEMRRIVFTMNYRIENLSYLYFYNDRKALYEINCMEYEKAAETMQKTIRSMERLVTHLKDDEELKHFFHDIERPASEYLGDAYCMKIYAEMFLQKEKEGLYDSCLREDTEKAFAQYQYEGELERNRQYRAHVEMVQGNIRDAFHWLLLSAETKEYPNDDKASCREYLEKAASEDPLSRAYYLMYYAELLYESQRRGEEKLAGIMVEELCNNGDLYRELLQGKEEESHITSDTGRRPNVHSNLLKDILHLSSRVYHPVEIICWKYAAYLCDIGKPEESKAFFERAIQVCDSEPDYTMMRLTALAILLQQTALFGKNRKGVDGFIMKLRKRVDGLRKEDGLPEKLKGYVSDIYDFLGQNGQPTKEWFERAEKLSERIAY